MATKKNTDVNKPLTAKERQRILDLHAEGWSRNGIARETGRSSPAVSRLVAAAGGSFDRTGTEAATKAAVADRKVRRNAIIDRLYDQTEKNLERLEAEQFDALVPSGPGKQDPRKLAFVPSADARQLASAMGIFLTQAANLEKVDADREAHSAVDAWLDHITNGPVGIMEESKRPPEAVTSEGPSTTD